MKGLCGLLCKKSQSPSTERRENPESPLTGSRQKPVSLEPGNNMDVGSHVRFQDSDLDDLEEEGERFNSAEEEERERSPSVAPTPARRTKRAKLRSVVKEETDPDTEDGLYSRVFEEELASQARTMPRQARKGKGEMSGRRVNTLGRGWRESGQHQEVIVKQPGTRSNVEKEGFDWMAGVGEGGVSDEVEVLRNMVYKLSSELSKEQGRVREFGHQLDEGEEAPWLTQLGGLVPLLVAYEEEVKECREAREELEGELAKAKQTVTEVLDDNTNMAKQLKELAATGPVDPEEHRLLRESAALVLEENQLLKEAENSMSYRLNKMEEEAESRIVKLEEEIIKVRSENSRLVLRNKALETESRKMEDAETKMKKQVRNSVPVVEHEDAVNECKTAFEELKVNYKKDIEEHTRTVTKLEREIADVKNSKDETSAMNMQIESELKLSKKMIKKYEELSSSLQNKVISLSRDKLEAEELARRRYEEMEKMRSSLESLSRQLKQQQEASRVAVRERSEDSLVLGKLHHKIMELKAVTGARVRGLEQQVTKEGAVRAALQEKIKGELKMAQMNLLQKEKVIMGLEEEKKRLNRELDIAWRKNTI